MTARLSRGEALHLLQDEIAAAGPSGHDLRTVAGRQLKAEAKRLAEAVGDDEHWWLFLVSAIAAYKRAKR